jgi:hypothetical protein
LADPEETWPSCSLRRGLLFSSVSIKHRHTQRDVHLGLSLWLRFRLQSRNLLRSPHSSGWEPHLRMLLLDPE